MIKIQRFVATYLLLFGLSSCGSDPYIYDRYDQTSSAPKATNQTYPNQGQQQPYQQSYYQQQPYQQQAPYGQKPYQEYPIPTQQVGGSRYYSNPYAIPPSPYYNNYDADQYYAPPTNYRGMPEDNRH